MKNNKNNKTIQAPQINQRGITKTHPSAWIHLDFLIYQAINLLTGANAGQQIRTPEVDKLSRWEIQFVRRGWPGGNY